MFLLVYNRNITGGILEEKLYFAPANYGKSAKHSKKSKEKKNHKILKLGGFLLALAIIIIVIIWLLHGKTTTTGQYPENVRNESLSCIDTAKKYDPAGPIDSDTKSLKINAIFRGSETLKEISLVYTLEYASEKEAYEHEAISHAHFNKSLGASSYPISKFSNKYARYDNKLIISLTANLNEIDSVSAPYFLISLDEDREVAVKSIDEYQSMYEAQGFICENTTNK